MRSCLSSVEDNGFIPAEIRVGVAGFRACRFVIAQRQVFTLIGVVVPGDGNGDVLSGPGGDDLEVVVVVVAHREVRRVPALQLCGGFRRVVGLVVIVVRQGHRQGSGAYAAIIAVQAKVIVPRRFGHIVVAAHCRVGTGAVIQLTLGSVGVGRCPLQLDELPRPGGGDPVPDFLIALQAVLHRHTDGDGRGVLHLLTQLPGIDRAQADDQRQGQHHGQQAPHWLLHRISLLSCSCSVNTEGSPAPSLRGNGFRPDRTL